MDVKKAAFPRQLGPTLSADKDHVMQSKAPEWLLMDLGAGFSEELYSRSKKEINCNIITACLNVGYKVKLHAFVGSFYRLYVLLIIINKLFNLPGHFFKQ